MYDSEFQSLLLFPTQLQRKTISYIQSNETFVRILNIKDQKGSNGHSCIMFNVTQSCAHNCFAPAKTFVVKMLYYCNLLWHVKCLTLLCICSCSLYHFISLGTLPVRLWSQSLQVNTVHPSGFLRHTGWPTPTTRPDRWTADRQYKDEHHTCVANTDIWTATPSMRVSTLSVESKTRWRLFWQHNPLLRKQAHKTFIHNLWQVWEQPLSTDHLAMSLPKCDEAVVTTKHKNQHWHTASCHCHTVTVPHLREVVGICHIGGVLLHHGYIYKTLQDMGMAVWQSICITMQWNCHNFPRIFGFACKYTHTCMQNSHAKWHNGCTVYKHTHTRIQVCALTHTTCKVGADAKIGTRTYLFDWCSVLDLVCGVHTCTHATLKLCTPICS